MSVTVVGFDFKAIETVLAKNPYGHSIVWRDDGSFPDEESIERFFLLLAAAPKKGRFIHFT